MDLLELSLKKTVGRDEDGKPIEVTTKYTAAPKGRMVRRSYEIIEKLDTTKVTIEDLDVLAGFIVDLFDKQFTRDDVYDGLGAKAFLPTLTYFISYISGKIEAKLEEFLSKANQKNA